MENFTVLLFDRRTCLIGTDCAVQAYSAHDAGIVAIDRAVDRKDGERVPQDFDVLAVFEGYHVPTTFNPNVARRYREALDEISRGRYSVVKMAHDGAVARATRTLEK